MKTFVARGTFLPKINKNAKLTVNKTVYMAIVQPRAFVRAIMVTVAQLAKNLVSTINTASIATKIVDVKMVQVVTRLQVSVFVRTGFGVKSAKIDVNKDSSGATAAISVIV